MTEEEWRIATDPTPMLEATGTPVNKRKERLFAVACARRALELVADENCRAAVDVAEQYADALAGQRALARVRRRSYEISRDPTAVGGPRYAINAHAAAIALYVSSGPDKYEANELARITAGTSSALFWHVHKGTADTEEMVIQARLLRDLLGNPFRPVTIDPAWRTSTVLALADGIYQEKAFDRMPILADALQDAGCDNEAMLDHCRSEEPHVRGCWVVDLLLGKS
jgi:hypothetical protein